MRYLPQQITRFIGREDALADVERLLASTRLLTLTGAGGVGKTRLALEVASCASAAAGGRVWLVELAALTTPSAVSRAVAGALGVIEQPGRPLAEGLIGHLRRQPGLLLLDNCEHVVSACAPLVSQLLVACPALRILATSRLPLGVEGEVILRVPPLSLPAFRDRSDQDDADRFLAVQGSEAVRLFADRAAAALPGFALTARNAGAVVQVCQRLDGIPLAVELAAAHARVLAPEQIAERLHDRFGLLTRARRQALPHHRTLLSSVEWSYQLLSEEARVLLRRASVFVGGWTLEATEAICGNRILDPLAELVDASLVLADPLSGRASRYGLLETIREYAAERLREAGEEAELRRRHRDWFLDVAERAEREYWGPRQIEAYDRLAADLDNLRAALDWTVATRDCATALRLAAALWRFWDVRGHFGEGRERLLSVLDLPGASEPSVARVKVLTQLAYMLSVQNDHVAARALLGESLDISEQIGFWLGCALALVGQGIVATSLGELDRAETLIGAALERSRATDEPIGEAVATFWLGELARGRGRREQALELLEEALALNERLGDVCGRAFALTSLGQLLTLTSDHERALQLQQASLELRRQLGAPWGVAQCLEGLAGLAAAQRNLEQAARLLGAAVGVRDTIGATAWPAEHAQAEQIAATVRAAFGGARFDAAWTAGRALSLDEAIDYGLQPPSPPSRGRSVTAGAGLPPLTRREREVARLIARGLTNRQIAETLVISELTAESHVRNILGRLGFANRAQIAAWAATADLG